MLSGGVVTIKMIGQHKHNIDFGIARTNGNMRRYALIWGNLSAGPVYE